MAIPAYPTTDSTTGKPMPQPSRPITYGVKSSTLTIEFDSGLSQRRQKGSLKNVIEFNYIALTATEYKTLRDFFLARRGPVESFTWVSPEEGTTYTVKFGMDVFQGVYKYHNSRTALYELSIKLEEVF